MATISGWFATLWVLLQFWTGIVLGWLVRPVVWLPIGTPWRALHYLTARAVQESGLDPNAAGDGGLSVGLLQFYAPTWTTLTGRDLDDRLQPFWQGYYGPALIADALYRDWRWWLYLRLPFLGYASLCYLWTHGTDAASGSISGGIDALKTEAKALTAWLWWALLWVPVGILVTLAIWRAERPWSAKERKDLGLPKEA